MAKDSVSHYNEEQSRRNQDTSLGMRQGGRAGGTGKDTATVAGSMAVHQVKPTQKGGGNPGGSADVKALGRAAAGKIESPRGKHGGA